MQTTRARAGPKRDCPQADPSTPQGKRESDGVGREFGSRVSPPYPRSLPACRTPAPCLCHPPPRVLYPSGPFFLQDHQHRWALGPIYAPPGSSNSFLSSALSPQGIFPVWGQREKGSTWASKNTQWSFAWLLLEGWGSRAALCRGRKPRPSEGAGLGLRGSESHRGHPSKNPANSAEQ